MKNCNIQLRLGSSVQNSFRTLSRFHTYTYYLLIHGLLNSYGPRQKKIGSTFLGGFSEVLEFKLFLGQTKYGDPKNFWVLKNWVPNNSRSKQIFSRKIFGLRIIFVSKILFRPKNYLVKKFVGPTGFLVPKNVWV